MKARPIAHGLISLLVVVTLLAPDVSKAAAATDPLHYSQAGHESGQLPNPLLESAAPAPVEEGDALFAQPGLTPAAAPAALNIPHSTAANVRSMDRLLFAPAIDADGDPATNPVESTPVPVFQWMSIQAGLVTLAVQFSVGETNRAIGVPVTFRVWDEQGIVLTQTVNSDAWGAASLEVPLEDVSQEYAYQASAPGYGETEMRYFRFDPPHAAYTVHPDGADLQVQALASGNLLFTLNSPMPLVAGRDEPALLIGRLPQGIPSMPDSASQTAAQALVESGARLPFPKVTMQVVAERAAQIEIRLPPGEYRFVGSLAVNTPDAHHFFSPDIVRTLDAPGPAANTAPVWIDTVEHDQGLRLVRYQSQPGQAVFDLVEAAEAPVLSNNWQNQDLMVKVWRTGPYEYQVENLKVEQPAAQTGGKVLVSLPDFNYDPIARSYTIGLRSVASETLTRTVQVDFLGAGDAVIFQQTALARLQPEQAWQQTLNVPAELGKPQGLDIHLLSPQGSVETTQVSIQSQSLRQAVTDDASPSIVSIRVWGQKIVAISNTIRMYNRNFELGLETHFQYKFFLNVFEVEWITMSFDEPPGTWGAMSYKSLGALVQEIGESLFWNMWRDRKIVYGSGGVNVFVGYRGTFTIKDDCPKDGTKAILADRLQKFADNINLQMEILRNQFPKKDADIKSLPYPILPLLFLWFEGNINFDVNVDAEAENLTLILNSGGNINISANLGIQIPNLNLDIINALYAVLGSAGLIVDTVMFVASWANYKSGTCKDDESDNGGGNDNDNGSGNPDPPDAKPADDRQDVWGEAYGLYRGETPDESIDNLNRLVDQAHRAGLWRAERLLTKSLREAELQRFNADGDSFENYLDEQNSLLENYYEYISGVISGTVPISPSLTITQALTLRGNQVIAEMNASPYARQLNLLSENVDLAVSDYMALYGQELELQHELRQLYATSAVGVLAAGFAQSTLKALNEAGLPYLLVSPWPGNGSYSGRLSLYLAPDMAPRALVVPTGGMHLIANSPEARAWLEEYVGGGGLLVVFTQAFGSDWQALPGGQVRGVGYNEDQRCEQESVRAVMPSDWLVWYGDAAPDIQVDGVFTSWPAEADLLLLRRSGVYLGYPAMIEYPFGAGRVLATSAYGDWAAQSGIWWGDDWQMTRSILIRAYLLANGQDIGDVQAAPPDSDISLTFPITNTASFTSTFVQARLPRFLGMTWSDGGALNYPLALATGESDIITTTLHTPAVYRGVHNWTQVGLYHLRTQVNTGIDDGYRAWGPFLLVESPVSPPTVSLILVPDLPAYRPFETAAVAARVQNYTAEALTVVLRGQLGLPSDPITLTIPANGAAEYGYSLIMDGSKNLKASIFNPSGQSLGEARLAVYVSLPHLQAEPEIPAPLSAGAPITITVSNQPLELSPAGPSVNATLFITLTSPSGATLWTEIQPLPVLAQGQSAVLVFTAGDAGAAALGEYRLFYRFYNDGAPAGDGEWIVPARTTIGGDFDQPAYSIRETLRFTATLANDGFFDLAPQVTIAAPDLGWTTVQTASLSAGAALAIPISFTLPASLSAGVYPIEVIAAQGIPYTQTFSFNIPQSSVEARLEPGQYQAGQPLTVTLTNAGGVDTVVSYTLQLAASTGAWIAAQPGAVTVSITNQTPISLTIPAGAAAGNYRLRVTVLDQSTQEETQSYFFFNVGGMAAVMDVHPNQEEYLAGETIRAVGTVTATQGNLSATLLLAVTRAGETTIEFGNREQANSDDESGYINHRRPDIAVDASGNAYAVWNDERYGAAVDSLFFAFRSAAGAWSAEEMVTYDFAMETAAPAIALDASGNAYVIWEDRRAADRRIYFKMRAPDGTWSAEERVDDGSYSVLADIALAVDSSGNAYVIWIGVDPFTTFTSMRFSYRPAGGAWSASVQGPPAWGFYSDPDLGVDTAGNLYAIWQQGLNTDVYFSTLPAGGVWSAAVRVNDVAGATTNAKYPALAVAADGSSAAAWRDERLGSGVYHIYYASRPTGGVWSANQRVSTVRGAVASGIAVSAGGDTTLVWNANAWGAYAEGIYFSAKAAGGAWSAPARLDDSTRGNQTNPALALTPGGEATAVWEDSRNGYGAQARYDLYSSTRAAGGGAWSANGRVNSPGGGASQSDPSLVVDAAGNDYVAFTDDRNGDYSVFFTTRSVTGTWGVNVRADDGSSATRQENPSLAVAASGDAYLVWQDNRNGTNDYDIRFAARLAGGAWSASVRVNDDAGSTLQSYPALAMDPAGNAYVLWLDGRNNASNCAPFASLDLYFAYRPANGAWGPNERVTDVPTPCMTIYTTIVVDAYSNAYAAWADRRDGTYHIYFAYRPAGGVWSANERVDDSASPASAPRLAVGADGAVYAVWLDSRSGFNQVYFASRPAWSSWSASQAVESSPSAMNRFEPRIAVNDLGALYVTWYISQAAGYASVKLPGGDWSAPLNLQGAIPTAMALGGSDTLHLAWEGVLESYTTGSDILWQTARFSLGGQEALWSQTVPVSATTSQAISETVGSLAGQPGKYWLSADLRSPISQSLAISRLPFYINPAGVALTLAADQPDYQPGETITVSGRLTNTDVTTQTLTLLVRAAGQTLLDQPYPLVPGAGVDYSTTFTAVADVTVEASAGTARLIETLIVASPQGNARLLTPDVAAYDPFSATLILTNTGRVDSSVVVSIAGDAWRPLTLAPGEVGMVARNLAISETSQITAAVRGDLTLDIAQSVTWGLGGELALFPPQSSLSGLNAVGYRLTGVGALSAPVALGYWLEGGSTQVISYTLAPGGVISGSLIIDLPAGRHTLTAELRDEHGRLLDIAALELVTNEPAATQQPEIRILSVTTSPVASRSSHTPLSTSFNVSIAIANAGPAAPIIASLQIFDVPQQWIITPTAYLTQTFTFTLPMPSDLPSGDYPGQISVFDQSQVFNLSVNGSDVDLALTLDQTAYLPGEPVLLTASLTEQAGLSGDYLLSLRYLDAEEIITVTLPANQVVQHTFTFSATTSGRASVELAYVPAPGEDGQRTIMIDSLPVAVVEAAPGAYLTFDQYLYQTSETISLTVHVTGSLNSLMIVGPMEMAFETDDFLLWLAPVYTDGMQTILPGAYVLTYTLPTQMQTGRYTFQAFINGMIWDFPVDVRGWSVTTRRMALDRANYDPQDTLHATVEFFNEGEAPIYGLNLTAWVIPPNQQDILQLTPAVTRTVDLLPGLNVFTVTGALDTPYAGPHRLLVDVGPFREVWRVAGAAAQFDVGSTHLVALTTDHGDYSPGQPGMGRLDVFGVGAAHLVITATTGATLFDEMVDLSGFAAFTFTIPTETEGDYLLAAHSTDRDGNADHLTQVYAVPPPLDIHEPMLFLTDPYTTTFIASDAPTLTLLISGYANDDSGQVSVSINGEVKPPAGDGTFTSTLVLRQGFNMVSAAAIDPSGNITTTPTVQVYLLPGRGMEFSVDRTVAAVGETITFHAALTATGVLSEVVFSLPLPTALVTDVIVTANRGQTAINTLSPGTVGILWFGDLNSSQTTVITATAKASNPGVLSASATALWGWGLRQQSALDVAITTSAPNADISLVMEDGPDPVQVGDSLFYTITVTNNGPAPATGVTLTDALPGGVTFIFASPGCALASGVITCALGTLANGNSATITITAIPTATEMLVNTVTVTANETDPASANNTVTEETNVILRKIFLPLVRR